MHNYVLALTINNTIRVITLFYVVVQPGPVGHLWINHTGKIHQSEMARVQIHFNSPLPDIQLSYNITWGLRDNSSQVIPPSKISRIEFLNVLYMSITVFFSSEQ